MNRTTRGKAMWVLAAGIVMVSALAGYRFIANDELNQAALSGNSKRIEKLLRHGANVNGRGMHAMTPLMSAAKGGNLTVAQQLIAAGADVNRHNDTGSALMWAVDSGNENLVSYLLQHGADLHWTNVLGTTALDFAGEQKKTNMIRLLQAGGQ